MKAEERNGILYPVKVSKVNRMTNGMFQLGRIEKLHDYFSACSRRREQAVFFYRVAGYSGEVAAFLTQYDQAARTNGVVIEGRIPNPDPKQLDYLAEMMGSDFQLTRAFSPRS